MIALVVWRCHTKHLDGSYACYSAITHLSYDDGNMIGKVGARSLCTVYRGHDISVQGVCDMGCLPVLFTRLSKLLR